MSDNMEFGPSSTELILVEAKYHRPFIAMDVLPRPHLFQRLDSWKKKRLTALVAPTGYGKTTLVASWLDVQQEALAAEKVQVAWLSLDAEDDDPRLFLAYLSQALRPVIPELEAVIAQNLRRANFDPLRLARMLWNGVAGNNNPLLLIIDDYQHIHHVDIHAILAQALAHGPANLHLMLLSRQDLPDALGYLGNAAGLELIDVQALQFQENEVGLYMEQILGFSHQQPAVLSALVDRCEGWVTGLRLAALGLPPEADVAEFSARLFGRNQWIFRFFRSELLELQPAPLQAFLLETSILEQLSAPLCLAVTGREEAATLLEQAVAKNLFITQLATPQRRYAFHDLFREMLCGELERQYPAGAIQELHRRAGAWLAENGEIGAALRHYARAGLEPAAIALLETHCRPVILDGDTARAARWLNILHNTQIPLGPQLMLDKGWLYLVADRADTLELLQTTEMEWNQWRIQGLTDKPMQEERLTQRSIALYLKGNMRAAQASAEQVMRDLSSGSHFLARGGCLFIRLLTGFSEKEKAREAGYQALDIYQENGWLIGMTAVTRTLSIHAGQMGNIQEALTLGQQALNLSKRGRQDLTLEAIYIHYHQASMLYRLNRIAEAQNELASMVAKAELIREEELVFIGRIMQGLCDLVASGPVLIEREAVLPNLLDVVLEAESVRGTKRQSWLTRYFILSKNNQEAWRVARNIPIQPEDSPAEFQIEMVVAYVSGYLARGRELPRIADFLAKLDAYCRSSGKMVLRLQVTALQAWYWLKQGDEQEAEAYLLPALDLIEQTGYVRYVLDIPDLYPLLIKVEHPAGRLFGSQNLQPVGAIGELVLTNQEMEILRLLVNRRKNAEIAAQLFITEGTVKWHLWNIYRKLGVKNRRAAQKRARELKLVEGKSI